MKEKNMKGTTKPKGIGINFIKRKWSVIAILLVAVIVIRIFALPAKITSLSGAITYYTNNSAGII